MVRKDRVGGKWRWEEMAKRGKEAMHMWLQEADNILKFQCVCKLIRTSTAWMHVNVSVSVKSKAGDLQVHFFILTNACPALSDIHWEKILCLPVSVGIEKIAFRYCLWRGRFQWSTWQDDFPVKFAIINKKICTQMRDVFFLNGKACGLYSFYIDFAQWIISPSTLCCKCWSWQQ